MSEETAPAGAPPPSSTPPAAAAPPIAQPTNGLAVASLVLGILAIVMFWIPFLGWLPVLVGLVLGLVALQQPYGRGMAVTGVVCSSIALALKLLFWVFLASIFGAAHAFHHHW
jgi:hypothetical protein